ncbi:cation diffusion facilitator family transporter [Lichenicoccus roseus]|uniref:Cation diffusion facilitator family transporter n=2 Tax=Lichenicoccus roseus TaxID=2683649 RepID=A0A5R9J7I1_9PROT|nr:cation diffusion facilitator family transporter [Lichenicoccus roseus]
MSKQDHSGASLRRFASQASLAVAIVLVAIKLLAWLATGSVALLTSAVDALVDTSASLVTFFGVRYAERPPDRDHRFGHGKGEAVAGFTQATFLAGAALVLAIQSVQRLVFPERLHDLGIGLWVIAFSLAAATGLVAMQSWVIRRTGSTAIAADRAHYLTDVAVNAAVLLALVVTRLTGWTRVDPAFALVISGGMLWSARGIANEALLQLLDRELPGEERQRIRQAVLACKGARSIHDLRTRFAGDRTFVEYHLEVDGDLSVERGHEIGDITEAAVVAILAGTVEVTAHLEPLGIDDERLDTRVGRPASP